MDKEHDFKNDDKMAAFAGPSFKTLTGVMLGKEWLEMLEMLIPAGQREDENSLSWQNECFKAFSTIPACNPILMWWVRNILVYKVATTQI